MKRTYKAMTGVLSIGALMASASVFTGCQSKELSLNASDEGVEQEAVQVADVELSGAQIWAQTCAHCHNSRSPASYSDAKWDIALNHMRQQAYLTGEQTRKIREFLKASN